ncbi:MAG: hypothetical protein F4142_01085 [Nitrospira sp. SB0675_bin_23]|nr:hypothetical protein [Nitrospira sp. SB0675_bin_23]
MGTPNWANKTIWTGDNLTIMRGMNSESVDLLYLDPPFNSNRDYAAPIGSKAAGAAFKDTWTLSDVDEAWHGEIAERDPALYGIIDAAGYAHGKGMKSYLIMMAVRLLEMRSILKNTGSLYLHCDPTANHYLKLTLDAIFGANAFRDQIVWQRTRGRSDGKRWGTVTDLLLFYSKTDLYQWNNAYADRKVTAKETTGDLTAAGTRNGLSGESWRGYNPTIFGRHWAVPKTGPLVEWIEMNRIKEFSAIENPHSRLDALDDAGMISWSTSGRPSLIRPAEASPGAKINNLWNDIGRTGSPERTGYPTQKPLALLERIIKASSNEGDVILDPFCGCATACLAAEKHGRQWIGIDISPKAFELVRSRMRKELGLFGNVIHRTDIPKRTDQGVISSYKTHKHTLFGKQEGLCNGCRQFFPFRNFTIDHQTPQAKGGTDHLDNLQLLCGACNSMKGAGTQEALIAKLKREGIR